MDIGLIFRTGEPLDRLHYFVGTTIVVALAAVVGSAVVGLKLAVSVEMLGLLAAIPIAALFLFRLRRVVDIGFSNWTTAGFSIIGYAAMAMLIGKFFAEGKIVMFIVFELCLLFVPTGANIRKD